MHNQHNVIVIIVRVEGIVMMHHLCTRTKATEMITSYHGFFGVNQDENVRRELSKTVDPPLRVFALHMEKAMENKHNEEEILVREEYNLTT